MVKGGVSGVVLGLITIFIGGAFIVCCDRFIGKRPGYAGWAVATTAGNAVAVPAAIAIAEGMQVPMETILTVIRGFHAVEHRIEFVATKGGVDYYNDSKGTNPEASVKAIEAMVRPTILIGGGYDKGSEFDMYVKAFKGKVKKLVLIGQTANKIAQTCDKYGFKDYVFANDLKEVVDICAASADKGDAVLLSPACASWGMFDNYEQRGDMFKQYVNEL